MQTPEQPQGPGQGKGEGGGGSRGMCEKRDFHNMRPGSTKGPHSTADRDVRPGGARAGGALRRRGWGGGAGLRRGEGAVTSRTRTQRDMR